MLNKLNLNKMKNQIFNQALGIIINLLTDRISGGFTTDKTNKSIVITFSYNHSVQSIEIQNDRTEHLLIFLNSKNIGSCLGIEEVAVVLLSTYA